jgi:hypothetical protein
MRGQVKELPMARSESSPDSMNPLLVKERSEMESPGWVISSTQQHACKSCGFPQCTLLSKMEYISFYIWILTWLKRRDFCCLCCFCNLIGLAALFHQPLENKLLRYGSESYTEVISMASTIQRKGIGDLVRYSIWFGSVMPLISLI